MRLPAAEKESAADGGACQAAHDINAPACKRTQRCSDPNVSKKQGLDLTGWPLSTRRGVQWLEL
jgi:hypothetical protein